MTAEKDPLMGELEDLEVVVHKQRDVDLATIPLLNDIIEEDVHERLTDSEIHDSADLEPKDLEPKDLEPENMVADNVATGAFTADTIFNKYNNTLADDSSLRSTDDAEVTLDARKSKPSFDSNYSGDDEREIFMQDVIDSMMPEIEAELRKRLLNLDDVILKCWHSQLHGDN
jgi:hypothetical protein